ncbi:MAG TPA: hydrogen peroxide-inducible genes activator [Porphyromonadaceae bacterium]|nr:hydrogen peroxide-inducible genes activator [Porphyromonadaceae bacterium]
MTIAQIEYLLAVANYGSFSIAAEKCFITQPSLSVQIKNLEEELQLTLIDRNHKPPVLTEAGVVIVKQAREAMAAFKRISEEAQAIRGEVNGTLRIGIIPTIAPYIAHLFVPIMRSKYPQVHLQVSEMVTNDIIKALQKEELDVAIWAEGFAPDFVQEDFLMRDNFSAYLSPGHPLLEEEAIDLATLPSSDLLLLTDGHCFRKQVLNLCSRKRQEDSSFAFECGSLETLIRVTACTGGITIIPEIALPYLSEEQMKNIRPIKQANAFRIITLATNKHFVKKGLLNALKESIQEALKKQRIERNAEKEA